jgi:hypothetical protein
MASKRELILSRVFVVLTGIDGITYAVRNRGRLPADKRPAATLFDQDEVANREMFDRKRISSAPNIIVMTPEIHVVLKDQGPDNETIGPDLNDLLAKIQKAVLTDPTLNMLVAYDGGIKYEGLVTDLGIDRTMAGEMKMVFSFAYYLSPDEL